MRTRTRAQTARRRAKKLEPQASRGQDDAGVDADALVQDVALADDAAGAEHGEAADDGALAHAGVPADDRAAHHGAGLALRPVEHDAPLDDRGPPAVAAPA